MPPKKKKSGKKGKKGKKSGTKISAGVSSKSEHLSDLSKEFYLIQIRDLENRLARYQKKCDELEVANAEFKKEYEQISSNTKEVVAFLKKSLRERGDEISDLNDRLIGLQQARESEKEQFDTKYHQLQVMMQEVKDTLTSENMILGGKLASLEEFKVQKEDLMKKFEMMEASLSEQKQDHEDVLYNLERKQVVDKDRLKKEMVSRVNQVASEFRKVSNKQMAETTKRTIRENVSINAQLAKMSDKTMELIEENDELKSREKKMKQQLDLLETNEKELAKKNHSNLKVIRMLTEKCKSQEALIADFEMRESEFQEMEKENVLLGQQVEASTEESQKLSADLDHLQCDHEDVKKSFATERRSKIKLEKVLAEAAIAIKGALIQTSSEDVEQSPIEQMERRDLMLENLLVLLNSAAAMGLGPSPADLMGRKSSPSKLPGSGKGIHRGDMSPSTPSAASTHSVLPHYQLGDLGIIPRPGQQIQSHAEKMKDASQVPHPPPPKKTNTRSVGVQTISAPKAMFFADQLLSRLPNTSQLIHEFTSEKSSTFPSITAHKPASAKAY